MQIESRFIQSSIRFTNHYFGWRNWSVLVYNSVLENVFVLFYIALRQSINSIQFVIHFFIFLLFSSFCTTYGYLINDLADKELDRLHGKDNTFKYDSKAKACLIIILFLLLSIILSLPFLESPHFLTLWLSWLFISTAYSTRPFRLKERGKVGLIFVVMAQRVLPALLIFSAFLYYDWVDVTVITAYILFRGLSSDVNHQLEDFHEDTGTETGTYAVQSGQKKTEKIFRFSLEMEKVLLIFCLFIMYLKLSYLKMYDIPLMLPILLFYLLIYGLNLFKIISQGMSIDVNPFIPDRRDIFQFIHHTFPSVLLPFYLILLLFFNREWVFIIILLFFIIHRRMYSIELIRSSFPVQIIRNLLKE